MRDYTLAKILYDAFTSHYFPRIKEVVDFYSLPTSSKDHWWEIADEVHAAIAANKEKWL